MLKKSLIVIVSFIILALFLAKGDKETNIFYTPHQDDETLFMSTAIINGVDDGIETIIVCVTDGSKSNAINNVNKRLEDEGFPKIDSYEFVQARNEELLRASMALGVKEENIYFMDREDKNLDYNDIENIVNEFESKYKGATHITLIGDFFCTTEEEKLSHIDHRLIGNVVYDMVESKKIDRAKFISYIENKEDTKKLSLNPSQKKRYFEALEAYGLWDPSNGKYSIGHISVKEFFKFYKGNPVLEFYEIN